MRTALIVVDVQNDFCPGGALPVPYGHEIIPVVNRLLENIPISVLTQDWHPSGHCSFASTFGKSPYSLKEDAKQSFLLWPDHCVAGSRGADFHPDLASKYARLILRKGTSLLLDSYSGFFENDGVTQTGLSGWLKAMMVSDLIIVGLATDYCVKATALDARRLGFKVSLVHEGIRGVEAGKGDVAKALSDMQNSGCLLESVDTLLRRT